MSAGTVSVDTSDKLIGYFRVASIVHYLIVDPTRRTVIHHRRSGDLIETRVIGQGVIEMDPPRIRLTVEEIFDGG